MLATSGTLLSALQLRPLEQEAPPAPGGNESDDDLQRCNIELPAVTVLDKDNLPKSEVVQAMPMPVTPLAPMPVNASANACQKLTPAVDNWLNAWNRKDVTTYLGAYSDSFVPAMGMSHSAWENLRKKRITKQGDLQATLKNVKPVRCEGNNAEVSFTQEYGSVDYKDVVEKTLSLELVKGAWRITREAVTKGRTY